MAFRSFWLTALAIPALATAQTVNCESAIAVDSASCKILWSRNADEQLYPASTTKIMTALLLLEKCKPDDLIEAPQDVLTVKESSMHLRPGEKVRAKDMLYALMLRSANDGCYAVANHISGSVAKFSALMNARARQIGCTHTNFDNPNGLNDKLHYTTAHDLALIACEAMKHPEFRAIVKTEKTKINREINWKDLWMGNHNKLLFRDPTCDGIKTGWTIPAGHCFVGSATRNGWRVITVVMKSKSWENDTETLFDWSFKNFEKRDELKQGQLCGTVPVTGGQVGEVALSPGRDVYTLVRRGVTAAPSKRTLFIPESVSAPVQMGDSVGTMQIVDQDGDVQTVPVSSMGSAAALPKVARIIHTDSNIRFYLAACLLAGAIYVRGRSRKRYQRIFS